MKTLPAKITISRPSFSDGTRLIEISVIDEKSSCEAISISLGYVEFAQALTGLGHVPCEMIFNDSGIIGKKWEHKNVAVTIQGLSSSETREERDAAILRCLAEHEIDGWKARVQDAHNHHNIVKGSRRDGSYDVRVLFERYVEEDRIHESPPCQR